MEDFTSSLGGIWDGIRDGVTEGINTWIGYEVNQKTQTTQPPQQTSQPTDAAANRANGTGGFNLEVNQTTLMVGVVGVLVVAVLLSRGK